jgi:hypothetical protein
MSCTNLLLFKAGSCVVRDMLTEGAGKISISIGVPNIRLAAVSISAQRMTLTILLSIFAILRSRMKRRWCTSIPSRGKKVSKPCRLIDLLFGVLFDESYALEIE